MGEFRRYGTDNIHIIPWTDALVENNTSTWPALPATEAGCSTLQMTHTKPFSARLANAQENNGYCSYFRNAERGSWCWVSHPWTPGC